MKRLKQLTVMAAAMASLAGGSAMASSHREAPFVLEHPQIDSTDLYLFKSYQTGRAAFTTVIANYQPFQDGFAGPNYYPLDPKAIYEIHFDNDGDAREDITFQFSFNNALAGGTGAALQIGATGAKQTVEVPLAHIGPITAADMSKQNRLETYSVKVIRGNRRTGTAQDVVNAAGGATPTVFKKPFDYTGTKTFTSDAAYKTYADTFIYDITIPGCGSAAKMFVGPRREGFAVNIGPIFDLVNAPLATIIDPAQRGAVGTLVGGSTTFYPLQRKNVTTFAMEIPTTCLLQANQTPAQPVIGAWQTASVRQARAINPASSFNTPSREGGAWTQVSRVGMPLVNEVVIGLKDKNLFNASEPKDDAANFAKYVTNPTLPAILKILFPPGTAGVDLEPQVFPRTDLIAVFLTGVPGVNAFPPKTPAAPLAEMMRLNTALNSLATQNNLGAAGCFKDKTSPVAGDLKVLDTTLGTCDTGGFPNGRRPGDDVVDVELRVVIGYLFSRDADAAARGVPLHDAVLQDESQFDTAFPYLKIPNRGANGDGT